MAEKSSMGTVQIIVTTSLAKRLHTVPEHMSMQRYLPPKRFAHNEGMQQYSYHQAVLLSKKKNEFSISMRESWKDSRSKKTFSRVAQLALRSKTASENGFKVGDVMSSFFLI